MARTGKAFLLLGIFAFSVVMVFCIHFMGSQSVRQNLARDRVIVEEASGNESLKHQAIEDFRERLSHDDPLKKEWSLEEVLGAWESRGIEYATGVAESEGEKDHLLALDSLELQELLKAIELGLFEIPFDPNGGLRQITPEQKLALNSILSLLSERVLQLAEEGDTEGAIEILLSGYTLLEILRDVPSMAFQGTFQTNSLYLLGRTLQDGFSPDEIDDVSRAKLLAYFERQASIAPIVDALRLHEAMARREVANRYSTQFEFMVSWHLAGYHEGIERIIASLENPAEDVEAEYNAILDSVPFYAEQTEWRIQNVLNVLYLQKNRQQIFEDMYTFLGM